MKTSIYLRTKAHRTTKLDFSFLLLHLITIYSHGTAPSLNFSAFFFFISQKPRTPSAHTISLSLLLTLFTLSFSIADFTVWIYNPNHSLLPRTQIGSDSASTFLFLSSIGYADFALCPYFNWISLHLCFLLMFRMEERLDVMSEGFINWKCCFFLQIVVLGSVVGAT